MSCLTVRWTVDFGILEPLIIFFLREGNTIHVLANELVPGDVVTFSTGDRIPADIRIVSSIDLEIDESSLTGETEARRKNDETCLFETVQGRPSSDPVALADRTCIAYMGTLVRNGELPLCLQYSFGSQKWVRPRYWNCHRNWDGNRVWCHLLDDARRMFNMPHVCFCNMLMLHSC